MTKPKAEDDRIERDIAALVALVERILSEPENA